VNFLSRGFVIFFALPRIFFFNSIQHLPIMISTIETHLRGQSIRLTLKTNKTDMTHFDWLPHLDLSGQRHFLSLGGRQLGHSTDMTRSRSIRTARKGERGRYVFGLFSKKEGERATPDSEIEGVCKEGDGMRECLKGGQRKEVASIDQGTDSFVSDLASLELDRSL